MVTLSSKSTLSSKFTKLHVHPTNKNGSDSRLTRRQVRQHHPTQNLHQLLIVASETYTTTAVTAAADG